MKNVHCLVLDLSISSPTSANFLAVVTIAYIELPTLHFRRFRFNSNTFVTLFIVSFH